MTFLQLVQRVCRHANYKVASATTSQSGMAEKVVEWVNLSWLEIQGLRQWDWMYAAMSSATTSTDTTDYAAPSDIGHWDLDAFKIYETSLGVSDQGFLKFKPWDEFETAHGLGTSDSGKPSVVTIVPWNKYIRLEVPPDSSGYTIDGYYWKTPTELSGDSDEPETPDAFEQLIIYKTMMHVADFEESDRMMRSAITNYERIMAQVMGSELPDMRIGASPLGG